MVNPLSLSLSKINIDWHDRVLSELPDDASDSQQKVEPANVEGLTARWLEHADELQRLLLVIPTRDLVALLIGLFVIMHAVAPDQ